MTSEKYVVDEAELKKRLTPEEYQVTRQHGTERAFTGKYYKTKDEGSYACKVCDQLLFTSDTKFDSGTGWPSFFQAIPGSITEIVDTSYGMRRVETVCSRCHSHLGHVFDDGPQPTGLRYCMNSVSLDFKKGQKVDQSLLDRPAPESLAKQQSGCVIS